FLLFTLALLSCSSKNESGKSSDSLSGAGATFPLPYYDVTFKAFSDSTPHQVTYGGIGSGGGIRSLRDRIVDFGATDAFLSEKDLAKMPAPVVHIPTCMGAIVMGYNLPEVKDLRLTGEIIADIYLGKITQWNDARIQAVNPQAKLPEMNIYPVYRSDGSGTTFVFTDYLSKISPGFEQVVGRGKSLKWPAGIAAKGNPAIAGLISQTRGTIGYIGSEYAFAVRIPYASIQNKSGKFVNPSAQSISAAAAGEIPEDTRTMITNSDFPEAYPISCFTWIVIYQEQSYDQRSESQARATVELMNWLIGPVSQALTTQVNYSPLPASTIEKARKILRTVTYNGTPILP
ncbi:MAG: phosphate ABC transporter substrate-binding protein PstS, partial [Shewanella sp.]